MSIYDKLCEVEQEILKDMTLVTAKDLNLDSRAATKLYISDECIAVSKQYQGRLEYYGGFEYVDRDYVFSTPNYVFYSSEDDRVSDHLTFAGR